LNNLDVYVCIYTYKTDLPAVFILRDKTKMYFYPPQIREVECVAVQSGTRTEESAARTFQVGPARNE
jgi:hypothetical protein